MDEIRYWQCCGSSDAGHRGICCEPRGRVFGTLGEHIARALAKPLCMDYPLRQGEPPAQVVIPRDITTAEAKRLSAFIMSLASPTPPDKP